MMWLALLACGPGPHPEAPALNAGSYAGPEGRRWTFVAHGDPHGARILVHHLGTAWEVRLGDRWRDAAPLALWPLSTVDGLRVDGVLLLPASLHSEGDVEVVGTDEVTVWYGTFDTALTVNVSTVPWHGEHTFAEDFGPIRLGWHASAVGSGGDRWELAGYEDGE